MAPTTPSTTNRPSRSTVTIVILMIMLVGVTAALIAALTQSHAPATRTEYPQRVVSAAGPDRVTILPAWRGSGMDPYQEYRAKPSYLGGLAMANLKPGVDYYLPNDVYLVHTGDDRWFIRDVAAPVLARASDADPYPFKLRVIEGVYRYQDGYGSYLQITLPNRYDFSLSSDAHGKPIMVKNITGPADDVRDDFWNHVPFIPIASVLPAPGLDLNGYYVNVKPFGTLPIGGVGYTYVGWLKQVGGTSLGYLENLGYQDHATPVHNGFVKLTRTQTGLMACTNANLTLGERAQHVPLSYTPTATETRVTIAARC